MTTMRFFVIGSWTEGMFHFQKLRPFVVSYESASIKASVYRVPIGFPVLVAENNGSEDHDQILGQLVELKYDETLLALMDTLHGVNATDPSKGLHTRMQVQVSKNTGELEAAQVYYFNPKKLTAKAVKIAGGIWQGIMAEKPPLPQQLTEKQKTYVLKLGSAKGRDIVPINDLSLYRELMKMELFPCRDFYQIELDVPRM